MSMRAAAGKARCCFTPPGARRGSCPAREGAHEGAHGGVSQRCSHVVERNLRHREKLASHRESDAIQHALKRSALGLQPAIQCPPVHRKHPSDIVARVMFLQKHRAHCAVDLGEQDLVFVAARESVTQAGR